MKNPFSYEGKRCLFAGCYSGMGEATARIVESLGGTIVAADIKKPTTFGYERYFEVDLRDGRAIEQLVGETAHGGPIDRVFYCAGLPGTRPKADVMAVNFVGCGTRSRPRFRTCRPAEPPSPSRRARAWPTRITSSSSCR